MVKTTLPISQQSVLDQLILSNTEAYCFVGSNTSGLHAFLERFENADLLLQNCGFNSKNTAVISFRKQQALFEDELEKDETDFLNYPDPGTLSREFISHVDKHLDLIESFNFTQLLDQGYRQLSTGQSRKLLILEAVTSGARYLVFENPFDGLDVASRDELDNTLKLLSQSGRTVILFLNNLSDIPSWIRRGGVFSGDKLYLAESKEEFSTLFADFSEEDCLHMDTLVLGYEKNDSQDKTGSLIELKNGFGGYGDKKLFKGLDLSMKRGDHTLITGSNGVGKSTLLQMFTGDNQKCYVNNLKMFGRKRGSGESIWELKKQMGIVSPDLHRNYRVSISSLYVIVSGFYDSIGLYVKCSEAEIKKAQYWLAQLGLSDKAKTNFKKLTFGEQRLLLIARALVKMPELLVLDEPTQGLDGIAREKLLNFLEKLATMQLSTILYVSHRQDEYRDFFTNHIVLDDYSC